MKKQATVKKQAAVEKQACAPAARTQVFSVHAPGAREVWLAGTFNGWSPRSHRLEPTSDGRLAIALELLPGRYEYKYVTDGSWCCSPGCAEPGEGSPECVQNPFGTRNRVLVIEECASAEPAREAAN